MKIPCISIWIGCTLMVLLSFGAHSKNQQDNWHIGKVTLQDKSQIEGKIHFNHKLDIIRVVGEDGLVKTFTPRQVENFTFFDQAFQTRRLFSAVPVQQSNGYTPVLFFEVLLHGEMPILGRVKFSEQEVIQSQEFDEFGMRNPYKEYGMFQPKATDYDLYVWCGKRQVVVPLQAFSKNVLPLMKGFEKEVEAFIRTQKFSTWKTWHQIQIVLFYNQLLSLQQPDEPTAQEEESTGRS